MCRLAVDDDLHAERVVLERKPRVVRGVVGEDDFRGVEGTAPTVHRVETSSDAITGSETRPDTRASTRRRTDAASRDLVHQMRLEAPDI